MVNKAGSSTISSYAYDYDKNGNRTTQTEVQNGITEDTAYVYDTLDRMKAFTVTGAKTTTTEGQPRGRSCTRCVAKMT